MKIFIRRLAIFIFLPFLFLIIIEFLSHLTIPKISHHNIAEKAQCLIPKITSNSIVILGDSRVEWGLKTYKLKVENGNVINLAMPGSNGFDIIEYLISNNIYPKTIILGFTPNGFRYRNHNLETLSYSNKNWIKEKFKFWLKQNSFISDIESFKLFLSGEKPYFTSHKYDNLGNVIVTENGSYYERMNYQLKMYRQWNTQFDANNYNNYLKQLHKLGNELNGKCNYYGLYMPVSDTLYSLEKTHYVKNHIDTAFDYFMDYSGFLPNSDSLYYYDGSHINSKYAEKFTLIISNSIINYERTKPDGHK